MLLAGLLLVLGFTSFRGFPFRIIRILRLALSAASLWGVISFSISGIYLSGHGDAPYTAGFVVLFPLRHYFLLYVNLALNGYPLIYAWHSVTALLVFMLLPFLLPKKNLRTAILHYVYIP